jgi:L-seryl-tRNA(Ser) seleniumtransferase
VSRPCERQWRTVFSGDKLLGGPQAGILLGTTAAMEACRTDPLARALRTDKITLAALEATLALYRDPETARGEIPTLRMLTETPEDIRRRTEALKNNVEREGVKSASLEIVAGQSEVGGGSFPGATLPTWLLRIGSDAVSPDALVERLRRGSPPIIARIEADHVVLDPRTVLPRQSEALTHGIAAALRG